MQEEFFPTYGAERREPHEPKPGHPDTSNLATVIGRRDADPHGAPCCDLSPYYWQKPPTAPVGTAYETVRARVHADPVPEQIGATALPTDSVARKNMPMATGVLDYFPAAVAAVAELSKVGNDKHNPGEPLHWARGKSMDHADTIMRHLAERGTIDTDGLLHDTKVAWRALAMLQEELERRGAPMSRGSKVFSK